MNDIQTVTLLSIDAWRTEDGWQWNNWHKIGVVPMSLCDASPRALFKALRDAGYLSALSAGKVAREDDGFNVVVLSKGTREPIFALAYGENQS